jgi:hypothetical protein
METAEFEAIMILERAGLRNVEIKWWSSDYGKNVTYWEPSE